LDILPFICSHFGIKPPSWDILFHYYENENHRRTPRRSRREYANTPRHSIQRQVPSLLLAVANSGVGDGYRFPALTNEP
jgi:hypothetical protein